MDSAPLCLRKDIPLPPIGFMSRAVFGEPALVIDIERYIDEKFFFVTVIDLDRNVSKLTCSDKPVRFDFVRDVLETILMDFPSRVVDIDALVWEREKANPYTTRRHPQWGSRATEATQAVNGVPN